MNKHTDKTATAIAKRVLRDAASADGFFDLSDAERLVYMLSRAAELGAASRLRGRRCRMGSVMEREESETTVALVHTFCGQFISVDVLRDEDGLSTRVLVKPASELTEVPPPLHVGALCFVQSAVASEFGTLMKEAAGLAAWVLEGGQPEHWLERGSRPFTPHAPSVHRTGPGTGWKSRRGAELAMPTKCGQRMRKE